MSFESPHSFEDDPDLEQIKKGETELRESYGGAESVGAGLRLIDESTKRIIENKETFE